VLDVIDDVSVAEPVHVVTVLVEDEDVALWVVLVSVDVVAVLDVLDDVSVGELVHDVEVLVEKQGVELWVVLVNEKLVLTLRSVTVLVVLDESVLLLVMEPKLRVYDVPVLDVIEYASVEELVHEEAALAQDDKVALLVIEPGIRVDDVAVLDMLDDVSVGEFVHDAEVRDKDE